MASERKDYLLQMVEAVGRMVGRVARLREDGSISEALLTVITSQEQLFARPSAEFAGLTIADQLQLLAVGERPETALKKWVLYSVTLREAGLIYRAKGREEAAEGAFGLALYILLTAAGRPGAPRDEMGVEIAKILGLVDIGSLQAPVRELLDRFSGGRQGDQGLASPAE